MKENPPPAQGWLTLVVIVLIMIEAMLIAWQINKGITYLSTKRKKD